MILQTLRPIPSLLVFGILLIAGPSFAQHEVRGRTEIDVAGHGGEADGFPIDFINKTIHTIFDFQLELLDASGRQIESVEVQDAGDAHDPNDTDPANELDTMDFDVDDNGDGDVGDANEDNDVDSTPGSKTRTESKDDQGIAQDQVFTLRVKFNNNAPTGAKLKITPSTRKTSGADIDICSAPSECDPGFVCLDGLCESLVGVPNDRDGRVAVGLRLLGPNPSSGQVDLECTIPSAGHVSVDILSIDGRRVRSLVHGEWSAGAHYLLWDGRNNQGSHVRPGVYLVRLAAAGRVATVRIFVLQYAGHRLPRPE